MYKDNTKVKSALFNGTVLDHILLNGVEVFKRVLDVFKNGVLDESCSLGGDAVISDGTIYNKASVSTVGSSVHSYCNISMDLTDYKLLTIKGEYWYSGENSDGNSITYGIDDSWANYLTLGENGTEYTIELDVTEYTGIHELLILLITRMVTSDPAFLTNYISEITLE